MTNVMDTAGTVCRVWWGSLQRIFANGQRNPHSDPAALAHLRRAADIVGAATEPQTMRLYRELSDALGWNRFDERHLAAVAVTAHVLAHVREDAKGRQTTAYRLGGKEPVLSPLRFQQLTSASAHEDVMRTFRSAVAILDAKAPVADLSAGVFAWCGAFGDDVRDSVRLRWIYDYHHQGHAHPEADGAIADATSRPTENTDHTPA